MEKLRDQYFCHVLHPHFVLVHSVGLLFGLHLAIASAFAIGHHARRSAGLRNFLPPPPEETPLQVVEAIGIHPWRGTAVRRGQAA